MVSPYASKKNAEVKMIKKPTGKYLDWNTKKF